MERYLSQYPFGGIFNGKFTHNK